MDLTDATSVSILAWVNLLAIITSPVIAVVISTYLQDRKEENKAKKLLLEIMISTRHNIANEQTVRAMNTIDLFFAGNKDVRSLWNEYFVMLNNDGFSNENGIKLRYEKHMELIHAMAKAVGIHNINILDISRVYYPVGLGKQNDLSQNLAEELLRVLKDTKTLKIESQEKQLE